VRGERDAALANCDSLAPRVDSAAG